MIHFDYDALYLIETLIFNVPKIFSGNIFTINLLYTAFGALCMIFEFTPRHYQQKYVFGVVHKSVCSWGAKDLAIAAVLRTKEDGVSNVDVLTFLLQKIRCFKIMVSV